ncbi:2-mannosyltransferase,GDP-Man:Man(3)GlcNAc(2)-PP-Dol alpha-1 [Trichinella pseudospiralis]
MLEIVKEKKAAHNHAKWISNSVLFSTVKLYYYKAFAVLYKLSGRSANVVMVNSTWTRNHILELWRKPELYWHNCHWTISTRERLSAGVGKLQTTFDKLAASNLNEKNVKLAVVGGCRDSDDQQRLRSLQTFAQDIGIPTGATVGIHTMWNEHFGIGIVEMMASGIIVVANDSGGPKLDIVKNFHTHKVGFTASSAEEYSDAIVKILQMPAKVRRRMQEAARNSVQRFGVEKFNKRFLSSVKNLI